MSNVIESDERPYVAHPPPPGEEAAGPALTQLVEQTSRAAAALEHLYREARWKSQARYSSIAVPFATDGSGNATVQLFEVPQDSQGTLVLCAVDEAGVTPQAADTRATLSLILHAGRPGVGSMVDCIPQTPGVPAQLPSVFLYGNELTAPRVYGPTAFFLQVQNGNASKQCVARIGIWVLRNDMAAAL